MSPARMSVGGLSWPRVSARIPSTRPLSSGLGGSAASAVAAVVAANALLPTPCSKLQLLKFAMHGEAVALGMLIAADLSCRLGMIDAAVKVRLRDMLGRAGLPTEAPHIGAARAYELMQMDKKVLGGAIRLVLLEKLGRAIVTDQYPKAALEATLAEHFK